MALQLALSQASCECPDRDLKDAQAREDIFFARMSKGSSPHVVGLLDARFFALPARFFSNARLGLAARQFLHDIRKRHVTGN